MTVYQYRCAEHGPFDEHHARGTAPATAGCPTCAVPGRRSFTVAALAVTRPGAAALEAQARSAERPGVVTRVPSAPAPAPDPRRAGLPRP